MKTSTWKRYKYQEEACAPFRKLNPTYDNSLHGGLRYDKDPTLTYSVKTGLITTHHGEAQKMCSRK